MSFACPYCQHRINLKSAKPGRYSPKCPKCDKTFRLTVPTEGDPVPEAIEPANKPPIESTVRLPPKQAAKAEPTKPVIPATVRLPPKPKVGKDAETSGVSFAPDRSLSESDGVSKPSPAIDGETIAQSDVPSDAKDGATGQFDSADEKSSGITRLEPPKTRPGKDESDKGEFEVDSVTRMKRKAAKKPTEVPEMIGGYRIIHELGRGGMGAVYLAQQVSLDRPVALKVMNPDWGKDPVFVARFTREAYAAAQLAHHNIVQVFDFGKQRDLHYFSMEFVEGQSLGDFVKEHGKIDVEKAVGFALQAARGLKFAHDRGMIHRDVKPDNMMLNAQGLVKVADLGLVKTPGIAEEAPGKGSESIPKDKLSPESKLADKSVSDVTRANVAMGTPAYMSPEQARDATHVDQRADVYSLGCALYVMLTGRPPYEGKTVMEIFTKHATAPLVPPDAIVKRIPKELSAIIQKMVAKKPEDRYADMNEVARALEDWLGEKSGGNTHELSEDQVSRLEEIVKRHGEVGPAKLRTPARLAVVGGLGLVAVLLLLIGWLKFSFGALCLAAETGLAAFIIGGIMSPSVLFLRVREFVLGCRWTLYLKVAIGALLFLAALFLFNLLWIWLLVTVVAIALGAGLYFGLDWMAARQRQATLEDAEALFKQLRLRGTDEEELRHFVCKYGGATWEEFYEDLFGYEEKLKARDWWVRGQKGQARKHYAAWREPIIAAIDRRLQSRRDEIERKKLKQVEQERLIAEGVSAADAKQKAEAAADRLVQCAAEIRADERATVADSAALRRPRKITAIMLEDPADSENYSLSRRSPIDMISGILNLVLGPTLRFVVGAALLAGFFFWMEQNGLIAKGREVQGIENALDLLKAKETKPLAASMVPESLTRLFNGSGAAVAGLLLIISVFLPNWKAAILFPLAAIVAWLGPALGVPDVGPLTAAQLSMAIGGVVGLVGLAVSRR